MKSEKKILIPGLGIANSMGIGCSCNMLYGELLVNPSTLLWLDKLCLPSGFSVSSKLYGSYVEYAIKSIFEALGSEGNLETISKETMLSTGKRLECLEKIVQDELDDLLLAAPDAVRKNNEGYEINGQFFCNPYVVSGYASQFLAHDIGASCLVDKRFDRYLRFKNSLLSNWNKGKDPILFNTYNEVFSLIVANDIELPKIIFTEKKWCAECSKHNRCEADFKGDVKKAVRRLVELRSSDSFCLLRDEIDAIVENYNKIEMPSAQDIVAELRTRALKVYKMQKFEFPRIKRWTNLAMVISKISGAISASLGCLEMLAASAVVEKSIEAIDKYMDGKASKGTWVNYMNKRNTPIESC